MLILDIVAWASVHAGRGSNVRYNGWKVPLMYFVMQVPLVWLGPGRASLDDWIRQDANAEVMGGRAEGAAPSHPTVQVRNC